MKKTLLLVFIHGFKGDDDTFKKFPEHIKILLEDALPRINIVSITYPRYETRGDLSRCVSSFKEWLENKVIDLEVAAKTPSPTIEPSVRVILVGHSMGGIVAAETLLSIARDQTDHPPRSSTPQPGASSNNTKAGAQSKSKGKANLSAPDEPKRASSAPPKTTKSPTSNPEEGTATPSDETPTSLFPCVQGILAFDTPFLGVHPGVIAHGTEAHLNAASAAFNAYNQASKMFGFGGGSSPKPNASRALPASQQGGGGGGGWGNLAMYAGGAAALAAAGGAAWAGRNQISEGWSWATSHLEFVGCLARGAELAQRLDAIAKLSKRCNIGLVDFYCRLGDQQGQSDYSGKLLGEERTFCVVPKDPKKESSDGESPSKKRKVEQRIIDGKGTWIECVNKKAGDEITAHRSMFSINGHPGYYQMCDKAKGLVVDWLDSDWYESSDGLEDEEQNKQHKATEEQNAKEETEAAAASAKANEEADADKTANVQEK
ncbi:hypothetical protein MBLNU457_3940t1 [Dothideomycetes sp. NU457]